MKPIRFTRVKILTAVVLYFEIFRYSKHNTVKNNWAGALLVFLKSFQLKITPLYNAVLT